MGSLVIKKGDVDVRLNFTDSIAYTVCIYLFFSAYNNFSYWFLKDDEVHGKDQLKPHVVELFTGVGIKVSPGVVLDEV